MTLLVGMVADDLTGALDAAAPFAERGLRTLVLLSPEAMTRAEPHNLAAADVICINTASREIDADAAAQRVCMATSALLAYAPKILFKKVDSRLKGHLVPELSAMLQASGRTEIVLAPAIPDLGRIVVDGKVTGMGIDRAIEVRDFCQVLPVLAPDTPDVAAMDRLAETLAGQGATTLAAGARGLALALAQRFPARAAPGSCKPLLQPALIAIGSRDPITRAQVEHAMAKVQLTRLLAPNGAVPALSGLAGITLVTAEAAEPVETGHLVAARFARGVADLVARHPPASMLLSGGETAFAILACLGVDLIELGGEALPGIPFATASIGGEHVVILTKSGGFGSPDAISLLVEMRADLD